MSEVDHEFISSRNDLVRFERRKDVAPHIVFPHRPRLTPISASSFSRRHEAVRSQPFLQDFGVLGLQALEQDSSLF